jgi:glutathione-independent formaldehyde dehydrogenase
MASNKAVAYIEPGKVEVQTIDYPKVELQDWVERRPISIASSDANHC